MAMEINTQILIKANAEKVWAVLTDAKSYPLWNPFIKSMQGELKVGNKIEVKIQPPSSNLMTFKPTVINLDPCKRLSWLGHLFINGLFDGEHKFEIVDNQDGSVTFLQSEEFKGLLIPLFGEKMWNNTRDGFELMNKKLKEVCEI